MNKLNQLLMGTTTLLLTAVMLTSCGGGTSSNTGGGKSSNTSSTGETTPVTPITSNTTPKPQPQNINLRRQNAQDTYTDCVRFGADNCDLDLRGVP